MAKKYLFGEKYPLGYNTYDPFGLNLITNLENKTEICIFYYDRESDKFIYQFGYNVGQPDQNPAIHPKHKDDEAISPVKAYERDLNLNYGRICYMHKDSELNVTFAKTDPFNIFIKMQSNNTGNEKGYFLILFKGMEENNIKISRTLSKKLFTFENYDQIGCALHVYNKSGAESNYSILSLKMKMEEVFKENKLYLYEDIFEGEVFCVIPDELTYFVISSELETDNISKIDDLDKIFLNARKKFLSNETVFSTNYLSDMGHAVCAPIYWNMSHNRKNGISYLPVSKSWVKMIENVFEIPEEKCGGPLIFNWDTAFSAIISAYFNNPLSADLILQLLSYIDEHGRLPQLIVDNIVSDRTNPPVIFMAAWNTYLFTRDKEFLVNCYHRLKKYYNFLKNKRSLPEQYLMSWGADISSHTAESSNDPVKSHYIPGRVGAIYESGLDDNPMWNEFDYDSSRNTLNGACVDLTALTGYAASILTLMAAELKINDDVELFSNESLKFHDSILKNLYDSSKGIFANKIRNSEFSKTYSPTSFYPLLFIKLPKELKEKIHGHFKNPEMFGTIFKIMSAAACTGGIAKDGDYWKGRIWPPLNYLICRALRMQGMHRLSYEIALSSMKQFGFEWQRSSHVHENYSAYTGFGEPQAGTYARTAPFYTWGALMGLIFIEEFFEIQFDGKFKFGNLFSLDIVKINNLQVGKNKIDIYSSPGSLEFYVDGEHKIKVSPNVQIFDYCENESKLSFKAIGRGFTKFSVSKIGDRLTAYVRINGKIKSFASVVRSSPITFEIDFGPLLEDEKTGEIIQQPTIIEIEKNYSVV